VLVESERNKLDNFLEKNYIFNKYQYKFRAKRATSLELLDYIEEISSSVDKMHTIGIFIDLQKAFETINHEILS